MGRGAQAGQWAVVVVLGLWPTPSIAADHGRVTVEATARDGSRKGPQPATDLDALHTQVRLLTAHSDPLANEIVAGWVLRGLPPSALVTFLEAARRSPQPSFVPALRHLMNYRRTAIRGRAMVALAALGGADAHYAIMTGLDDMDARVRRLAYELAKVYSDPAVEEAVLRLIQRDPELAADRTAALQARAAQTTPASDSDLVIIEDGE